MCCDQIISNEKKLKNAAAKCKQSFLRDINMGKTSISNDTIAMILSLLSSVNLKTKK